MPDNLACQISAPQTSHTHCLTGQVSTRTCIAPPTSPHPLTPLSHCAATHQAERRVQEQRTRKGTQPFFIGGRGRDAEEEEEEVDDPRAR